MKRATSVLALVGAILGNTAPAAGQDAPDSRPGIAVFAFENNSIGPDRAQFEDLGGALQQWVTYELAQNANLRVVDRAMLQQLMAEQDLGASGRVDAQTAARLGRIVGAKYVIVGSFTDNPFANNFTMTGRIIDAETTEIISPAVATGARADMYRLTVDLASSVMRDVRLPALPAAVREARARRPISPEAIIRHANALSYQDEGNTQRAIELFEQLTADFPEVEEWQTELRQLKAG